MYNKTRKILLYSLLLVCIAIVGRYIIESHNYTHDSSAKKNDNNTSSLIKENNILIDDKTKIAEVFEYKSPLKQEPQDKTKNVQVNHSVTNLNFKYNDKGIPILMYHSIAYEKGNTARVTKERFKEQMTYLKDNGYTTLSLDQIYNFFINNKPIPSKSIVLTFDDGYVDNYLEAFPILKEFGFKATIFIITDLIDKNSDYLSVEQLKEMQAHDINIESHTVYHEHLKQLPYEKQVKTLKESKEFLEKVLTKKIQYLAYPYGECSKETLKAVKEAGYIMAFTTDGRWSDKSDGILTLDRVFISGAANLDIFIERISNANYKF